MKEILIAVIVSYFVQIVSLLSMVSYGLLDKKRTFLTMLIPLGFLILVIPNIIKWYKRLD